MEKQNAYERKIADGERRVELRFKNRGRQSYTARRVAFGGWFNIGLHFRRSHHRRVRAQWRRDLSKGILIHVNELVQHMPPNRHARGSYYSKGR
jgi:hypothetical protein